MALMMTERKKRSRRWIHVPFDGARKKCGTGQGGKKYRRADRERGRSPESDPLCFVILREIEGPAL